MWWTIAVVLVILWLLGLVSSYTMGGFIHVLLVTADKAKTLPLPPIMGAIALAGGIVLLVMGSKKG